MISNAELTIYLNNGEDVGFELSAVQLLVIVKLLGIEYDMAKSTVNMFSDETLKSFIEMSGNPLKLRLKED